MIVTVGSTITKIAQVSQGDIIFNTGAVPVYVDTIQANVISAPQSSATPVNPGASIQWAGAPGLLYGIDPTGSGPGIGVTAQTGLPFPAPVGGPQYIFRSYGLLLYGGTPAHGNLVAYLIAPNAPANDPFNNALSPIFAIGQLPNGAHVFIDASGNFQVYNGSFDTIYLSPSTGGAYFYNFISGGVHRVVTIAPTNAADPVTGSSVVPGVTAYDLPIAGGSGLSPAINLFATGAGLSLQWRPGAANDSAFGASPSTWPNIGTAVNNPGAANELVTLFNSGPRLTGALDFAAVNLASSPNNAPGSATGFLWYVTTGNVGSARASWGRLGFSKQSIGGISGGIPAWKQDTFHRSAASTSVTPFTNAWPIPANDTVAGLEDTTYRIQAAGKGQWPNPGAVGSFLVTAFGLTWTVNPVTFSAGFIVAGHGFAWHCEIRLRIRTVGPTGSAIMWGWIAFTDTQAGTSGGFWNLTADIDPSTTIDTTTATTFTLNWQWAAVNGGFFDCYESSFMREEHA